jgi:class 3 adenylate cyclase
VAARIGALAAGGEILASAETLGEAGDVASSEQRTVPVRGVSTEVTVAAVRWD